MPTRAPRRCTTPGCPRTPVQGTAKCQECTRPRARPSPSSQGYGREHERRFRDAVLRRDPSCVCDEEEHGHDGECGRPSVHADHHPLSKRELVARGLDDHDPRRGRGLCHSCHSKATAKHQPGGWNQRGPAY